MRRTRLVVPCLLALGLLTAVLPSAASAQNGFKAPCLHGQKHPTCTFWPAKVTRISDGDTVKVKISGDPTHSQHLVRFTGIQAMELYTYSKYADRRRGACHGVEAADLVEHFIKRSHWRVRLAAQHAGSITGKRQRLRRVVWVKDHGHWTDLNKMVIAAGLALWLPNDKEWAHNKEYHQLAEQAALDHKGLFDSTSCGAGPDDDLPLSVSVNWDADGVDGKNLNGEWIEIRNGGLRPLSLRGWWVRDSWLYYGGKKASDATASSSKGGAHAAKRGIPGYPFPGNAVVPALGSIRVHIGCGSDTASDLYWCQHSSAFEAVTNDRKAMGDGGYLFDPQGDLRAWEMYPCVLACSDPLAGTVKLDVNWRGARDESIKLTNISAAPIDLGDHVLQERHLGHKDSFTFTHPFTWGTVLQPGQSLTMWPGDGNSDNHLGKRISGFSDHGGQITLRAQNDLRTACYSWGRGHC